MTQCSPCEESKCRNRDHQTNFFFHFFDVFERFFSCSDQEALAVHIDAERVESRGLGEEEGLAAHVDSEAIGAADGNCHPMEAARLRKLHVGNEELSHIRTTTAM